MKNIEKVITLKDKKFLLKVETSHDHEDYAKYEVMRNEIWGFPDDYLPGPRNLMCENFLYDGSALFIAAYVERPDGKLAADPAHLAGFSYGFVGVKDKDIAFRSLKNLWFYSQYTGVKEKFRDYGLGFALKEFQRDRVAKGFGISTITCTYDPLTGVNAWRNIHYFRMEVLEYKVATYGEYGGLLNRQDIPSDRFFMSWNLKKKTRLSKQPRRLKRPSFPAKSYDSLLRESNLVIEAAERTITGRSGPIRLEVVTAADLEKGDKLLFVRIPRDFYLMLQETDIKDEAARRIPLQWRLETRRAFQTLFGRGYRIIDFFHTKNELRRNFYVLQRPGRSAKKGD
jgi:predicted GNAT superfamily acetyltransferase